MLYHLRFIKYDTIYKYVSYLANINIYSVLNILFIFAIAIPIKDKHIDINDLSFQYI